VKLDLQNLDFQNVGGWPLPVKVIAMVLLFVVIEGAALYLDVFQKQRAVLEIERKKEITHLGTIKEKQKKAANLEPLKLQMKEMRQSFGDMLKQLPSKTEVAGLLVDISQTGLAAGLEFQLFKPTGEVRSEFYAEQPIQISVLGNYHEFGEFISGIAALPRIVTAHEIVISGGAKKAAKKVQGKDQAEIPAMSMKLVAKTYRALDEEEYAAGEKQAQAKKQAAKKGGKKK